MVHSPSKTELRNTWDAAAPGWAAWERVFSAGLADATATLFDMAAIGPGMRALDVACGAGHQTILMARRVGPTGHVVATDISATMLEYVRQRAEAAGMRGIETRQCAADELDDTMAPFDAAISRLGLMLFPSPAAALHAVRRVVRPGARFAAMVFTTPAHNPFFAESMAILRRHAGEPPPPPGSPGLFALGANGALESALADSGFSDIRTRLVRAPLELPSIADTVAMMQQAFGAYRAVLANLDDERRAAAWDEVAGFLKQFEREGRFVTESEFVIGSGASAAP